MIGAKRLAPAIAVLLLAAAAAWSQPGADTDSDTTTTAPPQQSPGQMRTTAMRQGTQHRHKRTDHPPTIALRKKSPKTCQSPFPVDI